MLRESSICASSGGDVADEGVAGLNSGGEDQAGRGQFVGAMTNRWPREETLALIKIRSEMDVAFRDSIAKGPLWEEVSRKLAAMGYHRSGKKCREKFENIYKYHKRTKDGRPSPSAATAAAAAAAPIPGAKSKTYRFFDQLEALNSNPAATSPVSQQPPSVPHFPFPAPVYSAPPHAQQPSNNFPSQIILPIENPSYLPAAVSLDSTSSSTYSDQDLRRQHGDGDNERENKSGKKRRRKKKKSEWVEMFKKLMGEVTRKQEELQKNLFDIIDRRERERLIREEAWRAQEAARINRECEMLARDRSASAAKDNAVISFLQRISEQQQKNSTPRGNPRDDGDNVAGNGRSVSPLQQMVVQFPASLPSAAEETMKLEGGQLNEEKNSRSSTRWPRAEVEALIKLRTNSHTNYGENSPKGSLWEEISAAMKKLGYNRSPKRCKEKWENINKYFKKVKESNKKRKEDSKTCPYFQLLDEIYNQKIGENNNDSNFFMSFRSSEGNNGGMLSAATPPLMVTPEQQWPPLAPPHPTTEQELAGGDTDGEDDVDGEDGREQIEVVASKV